MLKFQITTKDDLKEAAKIEKKRQFEEERKSRIFNAGQRLFGIDYKALKEQITEKEKRRQQEEEEEKKYIAEQNRQAEIIRRKELELKKRETEIQAELDEYRSLFQRPEDRREYDIEIYKKKLQPIRTTDYDPNLGISSAQVFLGEDLMSNERMKAQKLQQKAWLEQQIRERKQAEEDRNKTEEIIQRTLTVRDKQTMEYQNIERNNRKKMLEEIANYNKQLAIEQEEKKRKSKLEEEEDNLAEIYNHLMSDMLTESKETAQSALGYNRKIAYMYRGMDENELQKFKQEQKMYLEDKRKRENEKALLEAQWQEMSENQMRKIMLKQLDVEKRRRNQIKQLYDENNILAQEQKSRIQAREEFLSKNTPTHEYFAQFNTTSR